AHGVAVMSDGRIFLVGSSDCCNSGGTDFALARLLPNGTMDNTFGPNADGRAHVTFATDAPASANAVLLDGDGRAVVAGASAPAGVSDLSAASDFALTRIVMGEHPFNSAPLRMPGLIEAEDYDNGGTGLS